MSTTIRIDRIEELRKKRRWSQSRLAREMTALGEETVPSHISALERGTKGLGSAKLATLARALGTNANYLLGLTDDPGATADMAQQVSIPVSSNAARPMLQHILNLLAEKDVSELMWLTGLLDRLYAEPVAASVRANRYATERAEKQIEDSIRTMVSETTYIRLLELVDEAVRTGDTDELYKVAMTAVVNAEPVDDKSAAKIGNQFLVEGKSKGNNKRPAASDASKLS